MIYRGTVLIRNSPPLGSYSRNVPRVLGESWDGGRFLMSEVPLYDITDMHGAGEVRRR